MQNPWEDIPLSDYESHIGLSSVMQLQTLNEMMGEQLDAYPVSSVMILGIAGGNGLEHIKKDKYKKVYGVDVNPSYLEETARRYPQLKDILECLRIDLTKQTDSLPKADLVIADLLVEYIGYECFTKAVRHIDPRYVSCIIQINAKDGWVSESPYLHVFDGLERVHHQLEEHTLNNAMLDIGYHALGISERPLPNGKKLVRTDFERQP